MTLRVFRNYWQRPMAVLAGMEFLVFAAALCLISLPHFDGESPARGAAPRRGTQPRAAVRAGPEHFDGGDRPL